MEWAIERAVAYLSDHPPKNQDEVSQILSRLLKEEVGRRRKRNSHLVFIEFSGSSEPSSSDTPFSAADAAIDAERILQTAPPDVREAVMLRYGNSESWREVAARTASSPKRSERNATGFLTASGENWESWVIRSKLRRRHFRDREGVRERASVISRG